MFFFHRAYSLKMFCTEEYYKNRYNGLPNVFKDFSLYISYHKRCPVEDNMMLELCDLFHSAVNIYMGCYCGKAQYYLVTLHVANPNCPQLDTIDVKIACLIANKCTEHSRQLTS